MQGASILFLDQRTQVYFPSMDEAQNFVAGDFRGDRKTEKTVDKDVGSVAKMFTQHANFCDYTKKDTGVMPQIIVCDHADKQPLQDGYTFNQFVRARWRTPRSDR